MPIHYTISFFEIIICLIQNLLQPSLVTTTEEFLALDLGMQTAEIMYFCKL